MEPHAHVANLKLAGTECSFETGRIARQAGGSIVARSGEAVVLATVVGAREGRPDAGFFPLTVEYREKLSAAGRIPGTYNRREGRITDREVLVSRLIDRTVRSLFTDDHRAEVQIQVSVLSADPAVDPTTLALLAACAALHLSPVPCDGPAAGLRVVRVGDAFRAFPTEAMREEAGLDFVVSAGPEGLVMVEGEADEVPEADAAAAMRQALEWLDRFRKCFVELAGTAGATKWPSPVRAALPEVPAATRDDLQSALRETAGKAARRDAVRALRDAYLAAVATAGNGTGDRSAGDEATESDGATGGARATEEHATASHAAAFDECKQEIVRAQILAGHRPDGRGATDIRPIWSEVGWLPRAHGSAIFTRGETQALVTCTLGTPEDALRVEGLGGRTDERFILHYSFPPYCVGETRPLRGPGRREIGHGALSWRGLRRLVPGSHEFPYTLRVEAEISESNGSSSMATVCGASLALFHAGVPMRRAAAGIAMGMVAAGDRCVVLSDIVGEEDHLGDMDFKVVGTNRGITALQLDNKLGGLPFEELEGALLQARDGRERILAAMRETIAAPAAEPPPRAPRVTRLSILPSTIGILVGPRGATIKEIQAQTDARISVDDHGTVLIYAAEGAGAAAARSRVQRLVGVLEAGHYYRGVVTGVKEFGAFVKVNETNEGLVPNQEFPSGPGDGAVQEGANVVVRVAGTDERGRLRLSLRAAEGIDPARIEF